MSIKLCVGHVIISILASASAVNAQIGSFKFLATGDVPYSQEAEVKYRQLLRHAEKEDFAFLMHVGDIKAQSEPCSDETFLNICDLFREYPTPIVYTPGDNEWTDCPGDGVDRVERLSKLRELFFEDSTVLRLSELGTVHQSSNPNFVRYVENYRFTKANVAFIVAHIVGSRNNRLVDDPRAMKEFEERDSANLAFLEESFKEAVQNNAAGVAVVIHANPDFEKGQEEGFQSFLTAMRGFLSKYKKPVVCIHGDTHYYRVDKPLSNESGNRYLHFTRLEVFGSPDVGGVIVAVDPTDPQVFSYRPYLLDE
jgi:hypothetical protein